MTGDTLPETLRTALTALAGADRLLVASDFDGTLAPFADRPGDAAPLPGATAALRALHALPATSVALVSGRALADLAERSGMPGDVHLVGSHGSEYGLTFGDGDALEPDATAAALLARIVAALEGIVARHPGTSVETKPVSAALHVRRAAPDVGEAALREATDAARDWDGAQTTTGKAVVEFAVVDTDKGRAIDALRALTDATATIYLGDDVTDEKAFRVLVDGDVGVKVGDGDTAAGHRVADPAAVVAVLEYLLAARR